MFHIAEAAPWEAARASGEAYAPPSLASEGFIHFSTAAQATRTANRFYAGRTDLVLLRVPAAALGSALRYEDPGEGEEFPHLYAALATERVEAAAPWQPDAEGRFARAALLG